MNVAAIDCGTNSTRLLIADDRGHTLERLMRITRLGQGVDAAHALLPEAIDRTLAVLREYRRLMDDHEVTRVRLAATSAARDAGNAGAFFEPARAIVGVEAELLSGFDEGLLSFVGATSHLGDVVRRHRGSPGPAPVLVVDIGGGSTELAAGLPGHAPLGVVSLDIGCVRITERFFADDPPTFEQLDRARSYVLDELRLAQDQLQPVAPDTLVVGLAGTVTTVAALARGVAFYSRQALHHVLLTVEEVARSVERLAALPSKARRALSGVVEGREDVIVGGALILHCVMTHFASTECLVSEDDILDGLAASLFGDQVEA